MKNIVIYLFILTYSIILSAQNVDSLMEIGISEFNKGDYTAALDRFQTIGNQASANNDYFTLYIAWNNLGNVYARMNDQLNGLKYYRKALFLAEKLNDNTKLAKTKLNIGSLYSDHKQFDKAIPWYKQALQNAKSTNDSALSAYCLNNLAVIYEQLNENKLALHVYKQALAIHRSMRDTANVAQTLSNIAIVYKKQGLFNEAITNYNEALNYSKLVNDQFIEAVTLNNLANVYLELHQFDNALSNIKLAFDKSVKIGAAEITVETYDGYSLIYEQMGNYSEALRFRKLYEIEKDKMSNEQRMSQITELEERFQSERKQSIILELEQNQLISDLLIREQNAQIQKRNLILFGLIILISLVGINIYTRNRQRKLQNEINKQQVIKESNEIERQRISKDIHDDFGSGLSRINMLSELIAMRANAQEEVAGHAKKISESARYLVDNMHSLIWMLKSENTTARDLLIRIREYSSDYIENFPITLHSDYPQELPEFHVRKEICHAAFMTVKEALNNIIKHAQASVISMQISIESDFIVIAIKDNGIGFDLMQNFAGNGLQNMQSRVESVNGIISVSSKMNEGTEINAKFPVA